MIFKKPKTTNNFKLEDFSVYFDVEDESKRTEEDFDIEWNSVFEDPIYFWCLMQIFEISETEPSKTDILLTKTWYNLFLSDIWEAEWYKKVVGKLDEDLWQEYELYDHLFIKDEYSLVMYRIARLSGLFYAFDIHSIHILGYPDKIAKEYAKEWLSRYDNLKQVTDDDIDELYYIYAEIGEIDDARQSRMMTRIMEPNSAESERPFYGDYDEFQVFPKMENWNHWNDEKWQKISTFWRFMRLDLEFDKENMKKLQKLIDTYISETFDEAYGIEDITRKFIALAKKSEIIGNAVFIKLEDVIKADFPCLQYIYWLNKTEGCLIRSWKIKDAFMINLFDPTICHILGIWEWSQKQQENVEKLIYNEQKEVLELNGKKLPLWETNEGFVKEYFDLMFDTEWWVSIDELIERLEPNIWELWADKIPKAKKRLSYDRANLLNKKIAKLTGITGLFKIENGYIKLTSPIRVEKLSKVLEK